MTPNENKKSVIMIKPKDATNMGIIKNSTKKVVINDTLVEVFWPDRSEIQHFLTSNALKRDLVLKTMSDPTAKKYYRLNSNKNANFRRIISLDVLDEYKASTKQIKTTKISSAKAPENDIDDDLFDMNPIRKMSVDYKVLGDQFLELFENTLPEDLPGIFKNINNKLTSHDNQALVEVLYKK